MASRVAPMKAAQKPGWPSCTLPAKAASKGPAKANRPSRNSRLAAHTAILLTSSMKRKP